MKIIRNLGYRFLLALSAKTYPGQQHNIRTHLLNNDSWVVRIVTAAAIPPLYFWPNEREETTKYGV